MNEKSLFSAMQVFTAVVETGNFSSAARQLGLSQPSVSRQINQLEEELQLRLLQRTTRQVNLTEAGQCYYEKALDIQAAVNEAHESLASFTQSPQGLLRISAPHTWAERMIAPYLAEFVQLYPKIQLDIQCDDNKQDLIDKQLDVVIRVGLPRDSRFIAVPFGKVSMILCASPDYLQDDNRPKSLADLQGCPFIVYQNSARYTAQKGDQSHPLSVNSVISANSVELMISACQQGIGFCLLPDMLITKELEQKKLLQIMPEWHFSMKNLPVDQAFALYPSRAQLPAKVRVFLDFFKARFN